MCLCQEVVSGRVGACRVGFFLVCKIGPFFCCCVHFLSFFRKALFQVGSFVILVAHRWIFCMFCCLCWSAFGFVQRGRGGVRACSAAVMMSFVGY